jgi:chromosome partitioning protein
LQKAGYIVIWFSVKGENMKLITVTGYKGGCGKSTTAIHLATYFSERAKTLLIDSDPNRTSIEWSRRGSLPFTVEDERKAIKLIPGSDYVIVDTPARPKSDDLQELADGCDLLILPTIPDVVSLQPMLATADDLPSSSNYRVLICVVPPHPSKEAEQMKEDLISGGVPVFNSMIRRTSGFGKAAIAGIPIKDLKDKTRVAWEDYKALGKEVEDIING